MNTNVDFFVDEPTCPHCGNEVRWSENYRRYNGEKYHVDCWNEADFTTIAAPAEAPAALKVGDMVTFVSTIGVEYLCQIDRVLPNGRIYAYGYSALVPHHFFYQRVDTIPTVKRAAVDAEFPELPDMAWIDQMRSDQLGDFDVKDNRAGNHSQWNGIDQLNPDAR